MTIMHPEIVRLVPSINDPVALRRHQDAVLYHFHRIFATVHAALRDSVPKAKNIFGLLGGRPDRGVHATMTRYSVREYMFRSGVPAEDEVEDGAVSFDMEHIPNCGLCLHVDAAEIRILKTGAAGVPKANSRTRSRFYCSNQLVLEFGDSEITQVMSESDLKLIALWDVDVDFQFAGLQIACPIGEFHDGSVDCAWIAAWTGDQSPDPAARNASEPAEENELENDLDGITAVDNK
jgi:hypothetical protein